MQRGRYSRGDLRRYEDRRHWRQPVPALIERAVEYHRHHERGDTLEIIEPHAAPVAERSDPGGYRRDERPVGPLRYSRGGRIVSIR